jgi:general secretion pathway protein G
MKKYEAADRGRRRDLLAIATTDAQRRDLLAIPTTEPQRTQRGHRGRGNEGISGRSSKVAAQRRGGSGPLIPGLWPRPSYPLCAPSVPLCLCGWAFRGRPRNHIRTRRGLTLVEVLAVVVILGLIAATLLVGFSGTFAKAKHEIARSGIGLLAGRVEVYRIEHGAWPSNELGLAVLSDPHAKPTAPYYVTADQLIDPWGRPYLYLTPGPGGHPFEIISYGADGEPGGEGEDEDISSASLRRRAER